MPRFFLPPEAWQNEPALAGDEAKHLAQVLRIRPGTEVTVFDGVGRRANAEVLAVSRDRVPLRLSGVRSLPLSQPQILLVQAIPKGKSMDAIVQKAVELGVAAIQPLVTRHTIVQPGDGKAEKWRRVAMEACKQCGQDMLPSVLEPVSFEDWIAEPPVGLKIMASLAAGARPFREVLEANSSSLAVAVMIGPEGDFSAAEIEAAQAAGFLPVTLGEITLRVETATLYCLAVLREWFRRPESP